MMTDEIDWTKYMKDAYYLGLDLGTSSLKGVLVNNDGVISRVRAGYEEISLKGWKKALAEVCRKITADVPPHKIRAVGLSSQVGTYITEQGNLVHWWEGKGKEELQRIKAEITKETFLEEISMNHPDLISYPLPRYLYIQKEDPTCRKVIMPKEYLIELLTGNCVADPYSYRGLYSFEKQDYSHKLLEQLQIDLELPKLVASYEAAGTVTKEAAEAFGLAEGTTVYAGMNDFFAGLLGMGVIQKQDAFHVSGTSEHLGFISERITDTELVSGPYLKHFVTYGGTKSGGVACEFAANVFEEWERDELFQTNEEQVSPLQELYDTLQRKPPIFLPYLRGERAPIYDENARGVFFGISETADRPLMQYAVLEGVVFGLYDIAKKVGMPSGGRLICSGGPSINAKMALLKALLFEKEIVRTKSADASAYGAAMIAMIGEGIFKDYQDAAQQMVEYVHQVTYDAREPFAGECRELLLKRFAIFRSVYQNLKEDFVEFQKI